MKNGFSLMESMVAVLIFSFIAVGMYSFMGYARTYYDTNQVLLNLQREARQGMSWMSRELRQAYWPPVIGGPDANGNNTVTFNTPDAQNVQYSVVRSVVSGKVLWQLMRTDAGGARARANDITDLSISAVGGTQTLDVGITAGRTVVSMGRQRTLTFVLTQQIETRN